MAEENNQQKNYHTRFTYVGVIKSVDELQEFTTKKGEQMFIRKFMVQCATPHYFEELPFTAMGLNAKNMLIQVGKTVKIEFYLHHNHGTSATGRPWSTIENIMTQISILK